MAQGGFERIQYPTRGYYRTIGVKERETYLESFRRVAGEDARLRSGNRREDDFFLLATWYDRWQCLSIPNDEWTGLQILMLRAQIEEFIWLFGQVGIASAQAVSRLFIGVRVLCASAFQFLASVHGVNATEVEISGLPIFGADALGRRVVTLQ